MPPKTGPATAKKSTASAAKAKSTGDDTQNAPEPEETATDTIQEPTPVATEDLPGASSEAPDEANPPASSGAEDASDDKDDDRTPEQRAKDDIRKLYPKDTDLWFGAVKGLWFGFPRLVHITPTRQWLRQIYQLTEVAQTFEWMALAKVPMPLQNRTDALTDEEYMALFNAWFVDGEVELPK